MKVAVVSCSPNIDYVRARTIRSAISNIDKIEMIVVKNNIPSLLRYIEVIYKLLKVKFKDNPDIYILTFRGYEMLIPMLLISGNKPMIYDEFINPIEWLIYEKHKLHPNGILAKIFINFYRYIVSKTDLVLADTKEHALYSSTLNNFSSIKYKVIPVGTDEEIFFPTKFKQNNKKFKIFYYGQHMTPLHGLSYILESAINLKIYNDIEFTIIGGGEKTKNAISTAIKLGANIKYIKWIAFEKLPKYIIDADICLGGPFGGTIQSQLVVTGKTCQFLASQKPVIIGESKNMKIFIDKKNCILVKQANSKDLFEKILWAYKNKKLLKTIAKNGRETYIKSYSKAIIENNFKDIFNTIY